MNKKLLSVTAIAVLIFSHGLVSKGQTESFNKDGLKITKTVRNVGDIKVIITQNKSESSSCTANIRILKNEKQIDSLDIPANQLEGVGDRFGLLVYDKPIKNHVIISKFGSYDGKTIIINKKGEKFITIGGFSSLDSRKDLLFSVYHSDTSGFSVFDLNKDKERYSVIMFDTKEMKNERVREFYSLNNRYFVKTDPNDINHWRIWEIDLAGKKLTEAANDIVSKAERLKELTDYDYKVTRISCE